jgi:hypothetical protein
LSQFFTAYYDGTFTPYIIMNNYNNNAATTNHVAPLAGLNAHPEPFVPVSQHSSATVHSTTDGVLGLLALHPALDGRVDGLQPSSAAAERVFSLLTTLFSKAQRSTLQKVIFTAIAQRMHDRWR